MTSREKILANVKKNLPASTDYPEIPDFMGSTDLVSDFQDHLRISGGECIEAAVHSIDQIVQRLFPDFKNILLFPAKDVKPDFALDKLEVAVIKAEFGVAENGAVWIPEANMGRREIPVIAEHLVVVLDRDQLVSNMHRAYDKIAAIPDYGIFVSGPSKTADIEQSLVIGAHGPKSHTVIFI